VISPADARTIWALHATHLEVSRDDGGHWSDVLFTGSCCVGAPPLADVTESDTAYLSARLPQPRYGGAPLFKTVDGGRTWLPLTRGLPADFFGVGLAASRHAAGRLLAADLQQGVFASADGGATWSPGGFGLEETGVAAVVVLADGTVILNDDNVLHRLAAGQSAWTWVTSGRCCGRRGCRSERWRWIPTRRRRSTPASPTACTARSW
jgi:hypothetical protein